jgi:hypothetical protein
MDPKLFVESLLHQWGCFFNPPGQIDWQTGRRALDVYRCATRKKSSACPPPMNVVNFVENIG